VTRLLARICYVALGVVLVSGTLPSSRLRADPLDCGCSANAYAYQYPSTYVAQNVSNYNRYQSTSEYGCALICGQYTVNIGADICDVYGLRGAGEGYVVLVWGYVWTDHFGLGHWGNFNQQYDCDDIWPG
jgi:hypothetical protein